MKTKTCQDKVTYALESRMTDLRPLINPAPEYLTMRTSPAAKISDIGKKHDFIYADHTIAVLTIDEIDEWSILFDQYKDQIREAADQALNEYGLAVDYVPGNTDFNDGAGYIRYQISYGGPSEEFRFYIDADLNCYKIEFWYLDWFDGAGTEVKGSDRKLMLSLFEQWKDCEMIYYYVNHR